MEVFQADPFFLLGGALQVQGVPETPGTVGLNASHLEMIAVGSEWQGQSTQGRKLITIASWSRTPGRQSIWRLVQMV